MVPTQKKNPEKTPKKTQYPKKTISPKKSLEKPEKPHCFFTPFLLSCVASVRWLVFGVIWITTGRSVWFLPNILAEEALLSDLFRFMPLETKEEEPPSKLLTRFVVALFTAGVVWLTFTHAPDGKARARWAAQLNSYHRNCDNLGLGVSTNWDLG